MSLVARGNAFALKVTVMGTFRGSHHINPLGYVWRADFQKISPLASKVLVLEPKPILDPELEKRTL